MPVRRPSGLFARQDTQTDEQDIEVEYAPVNDVEMVDGEEETSVSGKRCVLGCVKTLAELVTKT